MYFTIIFSYSSCCTNSKMTEIKVKNVCRQMSDTKCGNKNELKT